MDPIDQPPRPEGHQPTPAEGDKPAEGTDTPDDPVAGLIYEYFQRRNSGEDLTPAQFAAEYPECADQLAPYLGGLSLLSGITGSVDETEPDAADDEDDEDDLPTIAGYELIEEIGRGGMGVAYKALQLSTKRIVALKVMLAGPFAAPLARQRFEREVELAARLNHPGIVQVFEAGRVDRHHYYSMDYIDGTPLAGYIAQRRPDVRTILGMIRQICQAVEYAHRHGVIHRDLKPANVLVDAEGRPHVLDFGLAKSADPDEAKATISTDLSQPGQIMGTLPYLSPEQADGRTDDVDARTDVYALGIMLYESLTGRMPYETDSHPSQVIASIVQAPPRPPSAVSSQVDRDLETIILKALEKERSRRYQSAAALGEDLRRYVEGEPILARRPSSYYIIGKKLRKHRMPAGIAAAVIGLIAIVSVAAIWHRHQNLIRARDQALKWQQMLEAETMKETGHEARVLGYAQDLYARNPALPEAALVCAQAHYRGKSTRRDAIPFLDRDLRRNPSHWASQLLLAEVVEARGDVARAAQLRAEADARAPDTAEAWYVRSFASLDPTRALHAAEQAILRADSHRWAWLRVTDLRFQAEDYMGAIQGADRLIQLGEDRVEWTYFKANARCMNDEYREAIALYTEVVRLTGGSGRGFVERANAHRRLGELELAVDDYTSSIKTQTNARAIAWRLSLRATPLLILGRDDEALADYTRIMDLLGEPSDADARAALILQDQSRWDEASRILDAALGAYDPEAGDDDEDPEDADGDPWQRMIFECLAGRLSPKELVERAHSTGEPGWVCQVHYYAGETCLMAGRRAEARAWFQACIALVEDPENDLNPRVGTPVDVYELSQWRLESLAESSD